jgi:hypothetical protein
MGEAKEISQSARIQSAFRLISDLFHSDLIQRQAL